MGFFTNHAIRVIKVLFSQHKTNKIIFICCLKACISAVYAILYSIKDSMLISGDFAGAEVIPVIKGFLVLPISIFIAYIYSNMSNRYKPSIVFYTVMIFFITAFIIYAFILIPNEETFIPSNSVNWILNFIGESNKHWIAIYRNWIHAFFYIIAEIWTQMSIFILFWEFVNRVCNVEEAKKSYSFFIASGSLSYIIISFFIYNFISIKQIPFIYKIQALIFSAMIFVIIIIFIYRHLNLRVIVSQNLKKKTQLSFFKGLKYISKSPYLVCIAVMIICVGLSINLIEVTWKANLKLLYPNKIDLMSFMSKIGGVQNFMSLLVVLFISKVAFRKFTWKTNAKMSPYVIMITGVVFFLFSKYRYILASSFGLLEKDILKIVVYAGTFQVISSKIVKYCFFDITKEIAYIPLDNESKVKGKAAIDSVGSRLGKSGSSYIHVLILFLINTGSVLNVTTFLIPILISICIVWIIAVNYLSREIENRSIYEL